MRGYALHRVLALGATYLGRGHVRGALLDLGRYPGLVEGSGTVSGEVYQLDTPELLPAIDREEGYNFERRRRRIVIADGPPAWAWAYHYRGPRDGARLVAHGDYRQARPPRG
jgi:gamma-glutamylcyclotransferase (GGCT)/AIG2-like uncharacterized protein YtfP